MKILVLSDSHSMLSFMRTCIDSIKPDTIVHLGDHTSDGEAMMQEYSQIPFIQLPGNCDLYRGGDALPEIRIASLGGVRIYMTHGHRHGVKTYTGKLISDARKNHADAVLYGHTHIPDCHQEEDGLWVLNPGSCGYFGGSAGLLEIENGRVLCCRLLTYKDLEGLR